MIEARFSRVCHFGCLKGVSRSVQVLLYGIEAVMVLTLMIRNLRALFRVGMR